MKRQMQMINQEAPVVKKISWGDFSVGFFRKNGDGKIFYGAPWYGKGKFHYIVFEDGSVCRNPSGELIREQDEVEAVEQADLGISRVAWA